MIRLKSFEKVYTSPNYDFPPRALGSTYEERVIVHNLGVIPDDVRVYFSTTAYGGLYPNIESPYADQYLGAGDTGPNINYQECFAMTETTVTLRLYSSTPESYYVKVFAYGGGHN